MPAEGKITLDAREYEATLARLQQKTGQAGNNMSKSMGQFSGTMGKTGSILSAFGSEVGKSFGAMGNLIGSIASGPMAALMAATGALIAVGVDLWDRLTLSAEEYLAKVTLAAQNAEKARARLTQQQNTDNGYLARLEELASKERLSNEAKTEAANLIQMLTSRYGELGISIDATTGKLKGMDEAQKRVIERQRQQQIEALNTQLAEKSRQSVAEAGMVMKASSMGSGFYSSEKARKVFGASSLEAQIGIATNWRDKANTTTEMEKAQKLLNLLYERRDLRKQLSNLKQAQEEETGEAATAEQKKATDKAQKRIEEEDAQKKAKADAEQKNSEAVNKELENAKYLVEYQKLINAGKTEEAERLKLNNELKQKGLKMTQAEFDELLKSRRELASLTETKKAPSLSARAFPQQQDMRYTYQLQSIGGTIAGASRIGVTQDYNRVSAERLTEMGKLLSTLERKIPARTEIGKTRVIL